MNFEKNYEYPDSNRRVKYIAYFGLVVARVKSINIEKNYEYPG